MVRWWRWFYGQERPRRELGRTKQCKCEYERKWTWKKRSLQQRGLPGGRGLPEPRPSPLSCSRAWSRASSRSTILTADTKGVGFCRAKARALLTTAHSSLPGRTDMDNVIHSFPVASKHNRTLYQWELELLRFKNNCNGQALLWMCTGSDSEVLGFWSAVIADQITQEHLWDGNWILVCVFQVFHKKRHLICWCVCASDDMAKN